MDDAKFQEFDKKARAIAAKIVQLINSEQKAGEKWNHTLAGLWLVIGEVIETVLDSCDEEKFKVMMEAGAKASFEKFVMHHFKK